MSQKEAAMKVSHFKINQKLLTLALGLLCLLSFQNCAPNLVPNSGAEAGGQSAEHEKLESELAQIDFLIHTDLSCTHDSDCEVLPLGARPCGGPSDYSVSSLQNPSRAQILNLLQTNLAGWRAYLNSQKVPGTCEYLMPPTAICNAGSCQGVPGD